jgi:hypothetical protein
MPENYVLLERTELNASATSVTFANIPQSGYTDLKVVLSTRTTDTTANDSTAIALQFNGDTASNYSRRSLVGDGSTAASTNATTTSMRIGFTTTNGCTANTFGNGEFYVPNYTGSTQKSVSADAVAENNSTTYIYSALNAGIWTGTAAITSVTILTPSFSFLAGSTFSLYGIAAFGTTPAIAPKASGGNVIATDGTYWYHAFTSSGSFTPAIGLTCDYLVVAGGGGATRGGGGAGGVVYATSASFASSTGYAAVIGAGGNLAAGSNSTFNSLTALGGGKGADETGAGNSGGSGSGASAPGSTAGGSATQTSGTGYTGYGNAGGASSGATYNAAGGGGSGGVGAATSGINGGNGGPGLNTWSSWLSATALGVSGYIAGGGGGFGYLGTAGTGGSGGGVSGTTNGVNNTTNAPANTGSGAGGGNSYSAGSVSLGGSGVVIIRYTIA